MLELLSGAIHRANDRIADLVEPTTTPSRGWARRVTGALFDGTGSGWCTSATAGPTCCATAGCERLTHDHSWVQSLVDDGKISEDEAACHPHRSLLLKVLNGQPANEPDLTVVRAAGG